MPIIGWVFIILALALIVGGLMILRNSANTMNLSDDKLAKIRKRKAELDAQEKAEDDWK